ncbi:MAG: GAF domain-containing protein [Scytolyngbya sp. HA4215-MV1]|jgi:signal transduction histidine kinase|nr:GAF domain-containing protein [Scytolyngbya sp. HA4215-MV1]
MNSPADSPRLVTTSNPLPSVVGRDDSSALAASLFFIQEASGRYLSFYWREGERYGIQAERVVGSLVSDLFGPMASEVYLDVVRRVLDAQTPKQFKCLFRYEKYTFLFELIVNPILLPGGIGSVVSVVGNFLSELTPSTHVVGLDDEITYPIASPSFDRYQELLTQIAWNIRRTLDPGTIWQQTVNGLGQALEVTRCIICPYKGKSSTVKVVAEYSQEPLNSMLETELELEKLPYLSQAISTMQPVSLEGVEVESGANLCKSSRQSILAVATSYQDQPNGLIILYQCDRPRSWSEAELEFMQELADQVGTAIAHATLFTESQNLATELQRVNVSMLQKNRELEDARQQAEEASRLKSEFLANTSHELRTPLNGMIGFLKLIMDGMADDPKEQEEFLSEAYRSALHLLNIINDVLDIAKIEAGKMQIELSQVSLDELLNAVENFTRSQIQQKNLSFEIQKLPTHDEIIVLGNYQRLLQVMLNLVGNAIKFTHEGGITISIELSRRKPESPSLVRVRVADTGIGVSLDKQDKLFQSFSQVDGSRTRQYGGTGLGLAISQRLVEAMGGEVNFYSMGEGLGSTVTFTVPLHREPVLITSAAQPPSEVLELLIQQNQK